MWRTALGLRRFHRDCPCLAARPKAERAYFAVDPDGAPAIPWPREVVASRSTP
jgi:hypothetical protein